MADIFDLLKRKALEQYAKGQPYRDLFLKGDPSGVLAKLEAWKNLPMDERVAQATDIGMGFAGTIKGVGKTPFEIAHEVAQKNAALPASEGGLGLPANNTAIDRAKAMEFDVTNPLYYGSQNNILSFDPSKIGSRFDYSFGHHTTTSPNEASVYADSLTNAAENFNPKAKLSIPVTEGANVMKLYGRTENPLRIKTDYPAASMEADIQRSEIIEKLWNARKANNPYDSVIIDAKNNKNFIALKPELLRSPNAAFDPFRRNEADILAGLLAVPATQLMQPEEKKKKRKTK